MKGRDDTQTRVWSDPMGGGGGGTINRGDPPWNPKNVQNWGRKLKNTRFLENVVPRLNPAYFDRISGGGGGVQNPKIQGLGQKSQIKDFPGGIPARWGGQNRGG